MDIQKTYLYEMPEINLNIDGELIQLKPVVELFIPANLEDWEGNILFLMKYKIVVANYD